MIEQDLQVRFNSHVCFVEDKKNDCCLVAKDNKNGRMFTLDAKMSVATCAHGKWGVAYMDIWHKCINHVNI